MRVLLTNDDGIMAPGLQALFHHLGKTADVTVVAPETEQSAVGHAITLSDPLRVKQHKGLDGFRGLSVNGTPADCVKIAVRAILEHPPDLIISGINPGANVGTNVLYSGTVSAATEGALLGIPSMAVSVKGKPKQYEAASVITGLLAGKIREKGLPAGISLNVNVPDLPLEKIRGLKVTRMGDFRVVEWFDRRVDPRNNVYYWQAGETAAGEGGTELSIDDAALAAGYVSVSPLFPDLTAEDFRKDLGRWGLEDLRLY